MPLTQSLDAYAGGYDPERYRSKQPFCGPRCDCCGLPLRSEKFRYGGQDYCLSCVLEEAEIERIGVEY
jgi:hypothetical protein